MGIPFTQYLMPRGRQASVHIDRPSDVEDLANEFIEAGGWFECEMLSDHRTISLTACWDMPDGDNDVVVRVVPNGPAVPTAVDELVREACDRLPTLKATTAGL